MRCVLVVEHVVIIDSIGGTAVLSCPTLDIKSIEFPFKEITIETIKKTILDYKYLKEEDANFDLIVKDNRPEPVNFNKQRAEESKAYKAKRDDSMNAARM